MIKQLLLLLAVPFIFLPTGSAEEIVFQRDLNQYEGAVDGMLKGANEDWRSKSFWDGPRLNVAGVPHGGESTMGLIRFDDLFGDGPGKVPPGAKIVSARLELYKTGEPKDNGQYALEEPFNRSIVLLRMLKPFQAGGPEAEAYSCFWYRSFGGDKTLYWGSNNELENGPVKAVDYDPNPVGRIPLEPEMLDEWVSVDITKVVALWQAGEPNHGLYLMARGSWIGAYFASSRHPDPDLHPKLTIGYEK